MQSKTSVNRLLILSHTLTARSYKGLFYCKLLNIFCITFAGNKSILGHGYFWDGKQTTSCTLVVCIWIPTSSSVFQATSIKPIWSLFKSCWMLRREGIMYINRINQGVRDTLKSGLNWMLRCSTVKLFLLLRVCRSDIHSIRHKGSQHPILKSIELVSCPGKFILLFFFSHVVRDMYSSCARHGGANVQILSSVINKCSNIWGMTILVQSLVCYV